MNLDLFLEAVAAPYAQIISRKEAKKRGLLRYFTGRPCPKAHVAERFVSNQACVECGRESSRRTGMTPEQLQRRRERHREWKRDRRRNDPEWAERDRERMRQYRRNHPEYVKQMCERTRELYATRYSTDPDRVRRGRERNRKRHRERANDPEYVQQRRERKLVGRYGITSAEKGVQLALQGGGCALCRTTDWGKTGPHVDHCHETDKNRGVLCRVCNTKAVVLADDATRAHLVSPLVRFYAKHGAWGDAWPTFEAARRKVEALAA